MGKIKILGLDAFVVLSARSFKRNTLQSVEVFMDTTSNFIFLQKIFLEFFKVWIRLIQKLAAIAKVFCTTFKESSFYPDDCHISNFPVQDDEPVKTANYFYL